VGRDARDIDVRIMDNGRGVWVRGVRVERGKIGKSIERVTGIDFSGGRFL